MSDFAELPPPLQIVVAESNGYPFKIKASKGWNFVLLATADVVTVTKPAGAPLGTLLDTMANAAAGVVTGIAFAPPWRKQAVFPTNGHSPTARLKTVPSNLVPPVRVVPSKAPLVA